jgi:hypothetical protein
MTARRRRRGPPARAALAFVRRHGVVLVSASGAAPSLAAWVAGEPIRGSWWAHARGHEIYAVASALRESPDVLVCRLLEGKLTMVHRRLWPALARAAPRLPHDRLARVSERHTERGRHETRETPFPGWVPPDVRAAARRLTLEQALLQLATAHVTTP